MAKDEVEATQRQLTNERVIGSGENQDGELSCKEMPGVRARADNEGDTGRR